MTERPLCDFDCGRKSVINVGKVNLCGQCVAKALEVDIPGPRLRFEDVLVPDRPDEDECL